MSMYFECELKDLNIDEVLRSSVYIEPEDLVVLYREKIRVYAEKFRRRRREVND